MRSELGDKIRLQHIASIRTSARKKADPPHFLKILFAEPNCTHLVLPDIQTDLSKN